MCHTLFILIMVRLTHLRKGIITYLLIIYTSNCLKADVIMHFIQDYTCMILDL